MSELPLGWSRASLADVAAWGSGGTPQARNPKYYGGEIPWAVIGDLNDGTVRETRSAITEAGLANSSAKLVPEGAILVAMYGSIGKLGIAGHVMSTNQAIAFATPGQRLLAKYLFYYLLSVRPALDGAGKGATQRNISQTILKAWPIPFPDDLDEQRRIVDILEDHLSRLDAAIVGTQRAQQRLDAWGLSNLSAMRQASDVERLVELGEIAETALGKMLDAKNTKGTQTPYLRNINVRWGMVDLTDVRTVPLTESERVRLTLLPDDLLVCEGGEPGRTALWNGYRDDMAFQKALHRVRVRDRSAMLPAYLALMLREAVLTKRVDHLFTGTTIKHLPQEKLRRIKVAHPSLAVQALIVDTWEQQTTARDHMQASVLGTERRAVALKRALLQAAFSGRLTGSASDLDLAAELATHESLEQV